MKRRGFLGLLGLAPFVRKFSIKGTGRKLPYGEMGLSAHLKEHDPKDYVGLCRDKEWTPSKDDVIVMMAGGIDNPKERGIIKNIKREYIV